MPQTPILNDQIANNYRIFALIFNNKITCLLLKSGQNAFPFLQSQPKRNLPEPWPIMSLPVAHQRRAYTQKNARGMDCPTGVFTGYAYKGGSPLFTTG
jgi:hypothetical protein